MNHWWYQDVGVNVDQATILAIRMGARVAGVSILRYISISILIKYSNFSGFYKKLGPFYKKLRCDKFGNWSISTKNALNNQIQSSIKIDMYIVRNCCLPIADFETTGVHVNHVDSVVMPNQTKPIAWILGRKSQQEKRMLLTFQIGKMWVSAFLLWEWSTH